ncbi:MAG TPA: stage II sporulation protein M [Firmicutes bacterium]|nr:stage II sporulation protein M [Bacillota bacterium]
MILVGRLETAWAMHMRAHIRTYLVAGIMVLMGVVFGSLAVRVLDSPQRQELRGYLYTFVSYFLEAPGEAASPALKDAVLESLKRAGLMFALGISVIGAPFVPVILFARGFSLGFTVGLMVDEMALKGTVLALAAVFPHNVVALPANMVIGAESLSFALAWIGSRIFKRESTPAQVFIPAVLMSCLMVVALCIAACIEVYLTPVLAQLAVRKLT